MAAAGASGSADGTEGITAAIDRLRMTEDWQVWKDTVQQLVLGHGGIIEALEMEVTNNGASIKSIEDVGNGMQRNVQDALGLVNARIEVLGNTEDHTRSKCDVLVEELKGKLGEYDKLKVAFEELQNKLNTEWAGLERWAAMNKGGLEEAQERIKKIEEAMQNTGGGGLTDYDRSVIVGMEGRIKKIEEALQNNGGGGGAPHPQRNDRIDNRPILECRAISNLKVLGDDKNHYQEWIEAMRNVL